MQRRFWLLALIVVAAIYSTVGLAGTLAAQLRNQGLLGFSFGLGFLVVIAAIVGSVFKSVPRWRETWVVLGVATVYGMVVVRMGIGPEERTHIFEYGLVATFIHQALLERRHPDRRIVKSALIAVGATALLSWIDEGIQWILPNRVYDIRDVGVNALAGLMAILARLVLMWAQRRRRRGGGGEARKAPPEPLTARYPVSRPRRQCARVRPVRGRERSRPSRLRPW